MLRGFGHRSHHRYPLLRHGLCRGPCRGSGAFRRAAVLRGGTWPACSPLPLRLHVQQNMRTISLLLAGALFVSSAFASEESFEKDRKAILSMAGDFKVGFHFQETLSLHAGYKPEEKPYKEEAFETVK